MFSNNWFQQFLQTSCWRKTCFAHSTFDFLTAPQWWGPTTVRKAWGDFSLGYFIFSISLSEDNKTCFPFSPKEIGTFLLTTCCLKFIFLLWLSWIGWVVWVNFKIKDCPSFYWKDKHYDQNFHSYEAVNITEIHLGFLIRVYTHIWSDFIIPSSPFAECRESQYSGQGEWPYRDHWNRYGCMVWGRGQELFLSHMHSQLIQHHLFKT